MSNDKPRIDVGEVFHSYSRKVLREYEEAKAASQKLSFDSGPATEKAVRDFFAQRLPGRYGVGEGFVIDAEGNQSKQCDVVIFDKERTTVMSTEQSLTFWPFESVYGVVQVKSKLTKPALQSAVENIAAFKRLRRERNDCVRVGGMVSNVGYQNPPFGMLVAHEEDPALRPGAHEFDNIVGSVDVTHQIDAYCIASGTMGCRGAIQPDGTGAIGLLDERKQPHAALVRIDQDDGVMARFLFAAISIMNEIRLGAPNLLAYQRFLRK